MRRQIGIERFDMSLTQMANAIVNAPREHTVSVIQNLLGERIRLCSRNERGVPDQKAVALWMNELSMRVQIHHLATGRVRVSPPERRRYNIARLEGAYAALVAMITRLFTDL